MVESYTVPSTSLTHFEEEVNRKFFTIFLIMKTVL